MREEETAGLADKLNRLFAMVRPDSGHEYGNEQAAASIRGTGVSISQSCLRQLRRDRKSNPTLPHVQALADFFGVPSAYFFEDAVTDRITGQLEQPAAKQARMREAAQSSDVSVERRVTDAVFPASAPPAPQRRRGSRGPRPSPQSTHGGIPLPRPTVRRCTGPGRAPGGPSPPGRRKRRCAATAGTMGGGRRRPRARRAAAHPRNSKRILSLRRTLSWPQRPPILAGRKALSRHLAAVPSPSGVPVEATPEQLR